MPQQKDFQAKFKIRIVITALAFMLIIGSAFTLGIVSTTSQDIRSLAEPSSCVGDCIYSVGGVGAAAACYRGYCLDPNQNCSFNVNCGWVGGCAGQNQVTCPGYPIETPIPSSTVIPTPTINLSVCTLPDGCNNTCNVGADCSKCSNGNYTCVQKPPTLTPGNSNITSTPIPTPTFVPLPTFEASPTPTIDPVAYQGRTEPCTNEAYIEIIDRNRDATTYSDDYNRFLYACTKLCRFPGPQTCTWNPYNTITPGIGGPITFPSPTLTSIIEPTTTLYPTVTKSQNDLSQPICPGHTNWSASAASIKYLPYYNNDGQPVRPDTRDCIKPNKIVLHWSAQGPPSHTNEATYNALFSRGRSCQLGIGEDTGIEQWQEMYTDRVEMAWCAGAAANPSSINIEIAGCDFDANPQIAPGCIPAGSNLPTNRQYETTLSLICQLQKQYNIPTRQIFGHYELQSGKSDPGIKFMDVRIRPDLLRICPL